VALGHRKVLRPLIIIPHSEVGTTGHPFFAMEKVWEDLVSLLRGGGNAREASTNCRFYGGEKGGETRVRINVCGSSTKKKKKVYYDEGKKKVRDYELLLKESLSRANN